MSRLITIFLILSCTGCTITVRPLPQKKRVIYHSTKRLKGKAKPANGTVVDHSWLVQYQQLEEDHGGYRISDDHKVQTLGSGKYKVPRSMLDHFRDLSLAPAVTPSPTPK